MHKKSIITILCEILCVRLLLSAFPPLLDGCVTNLGKQLLLFLTKLGKGLS